MSNSLPSLVLPVANPNVFQRSGAKVWYVDPVYGNNAHSGQSPKGAFATLTKALSVAGAKGDIIYYYPGYSDETVALTSANNNITIIGLGGRGACGVAPTAAGAEGMQIVADDVTLINFGVDGDDTADYGLNLNGARRVRLIGCKFELGDGAGPAALVDGNATRGCSDILFEDCEFAWAGRGLGFASAGTDPSTEVFLQNCRFHNIATASVGKLAANDYAANLELIDCVFDVNEAGTKPSDYLLIDGAGTTGVVSGCRFALATNASADLKIAAGVFWATNYTEAGSSAARPA